MDLGGKNVVYFGGCGGIGSETCKQLVQKNVANLAILDATENSDLIEGLAKQSTKVFFLKVDIRRKETITECLQEVVSRMGHIDVVINGIGIFNELDVELLIGINLVGLVNASMAALNLMDKSKGNRGGIILNIASVAGLDPMHGLPIYCASKGGVVLFTRSIAGKFTETGVSCITVCPGITSTPLLDQFTSEQTSPNAKNITHFFNVVKKQTPSDLATNIIEIVEMNKNGAVYQCDVGECTEVSFTKFWNPQL